MATISMQKDFKLDVHKNKKAWTELKKQMDENKPFVEFTSGMKIDIK